MVERSEIDTSGENKGPSLEEESQQQDDAADKQNGDSGLPSDKDNKQANDKNGSDDDRPDWLPEKFESPEDMAKAYKELEAKLSSGDTESAQNDQQQQQQAAEEAVENAGLDMQSLANEYSENGELTQESLEALEKVGITKDVVDQFISGQQAVAQQMHTEVVDEVGGKEAYDTMVEWAADNLPDEEVDAFNDALDSGNIQQIKLAVRGLQAQFTESEGMEPSRHLGGSNSGDGLATYTSTEQMMRDMQDPRYAEDPAFRKQVEQKLARSSIL